MDIESLKGKTGGWTYGVEHELSDWPRCVQLPEGYGIDRTDPTMVNSNGIAVDPKAISYGFGGEIQTPPTKSIKEQVLCLRTIKKLLPMASVNYRSNLHTHVRVPGLIDDLTVLKQIQRYIHQTMPTALQLLECLPRPSKAEFRSQEEYAGALRRWRRRRVSHQTLLTPSRLSRQLTAKSTNEFFNLEPPQDSRGTPLFHAQPRLCVNLRQLLQTDTIEFRHFSGTLDEGLLRNCLEWSRDYLLCALAEVPIQTLLARYRKRAFPPFQPYNHALEVTYRQTCHDGTLSRIQIEKNIADILERKS